MTVYIALLRAINVGKRQVPMKALQALAEELGFINVRTYVASGNLVLSSGADASAVEKALDAAISNRFGFPVETVVRSASEWDRLSKANPFAEASEKEPNRVMLLISKTPVVAGAAARIGERAQAGETVKEAGGAIWIHYPAGIGTSKLAPTLIDRACGSPTTGRNVRTVAKLTEMAAR